MGFSVWWLMIKYGFLWMKCICWVETVPMTSGNQDVPQGKVQWTEKISIYSRYICLLDEELEMTK